MSQLAAMPTLVRSPAAPDVPETRLQGHWLVLARAAWLALAALTLAVFVASLPAYFTQLQTICRAAPCPTWQITPAEARAIQQLGLSLSGFAASQVAWSVVIELVPFAVAGVLFWRRSDERIALLVALFLVLGLADLNNNLMALAAFLPAWVLPVRVVKAVAGVAWYVLYLFPDGRFVPRWTRWLCLGGALVSLPVNLFPGSALDVSTQFDRLYLAYIGVQAFVLLALQLYRYRRVSTPVQRQQTKWAVFGIGVGCLLAGALQIADPAVTHQVPPRSVLDLLAGLVAPVVLLLIPLSIGLAILRSRLWDIDTLINKALVYGSLTVLLGALYAGLIVGLESLAGMFAGQAQTNPLVLVVSTLAIAALFLPARRRIQSIIDRRFYRRKYDAEKTLAEFSAALRNQVDLEQVRAHLIAVVQETMQPTHVSLWLRQPDRHPADLTQSLE